MKNEIKNVEMYLYEISGYYFADGERKHFEKELYAQDNMEAMAIVIGQLAWKESLEGRTFKLEHIHYECL